MRLRIGAILAGLVLPLVLHAQAFKPLHDGWSLASSCSLHEDGAEISSAKFLARDWLKTSVPSTVLAAQVAAKVYPDPYFGDNLRHLPGMGYPVGENFSDLPMSKDSPNTCGWWYRTSFHVSAPHGHNLHTWIHFGGINYRAEVWVNGRRIAGSDDIAGAYRTYDLDVTDALSLDGNNVLAVETFALSENDLSINWVDWNPTPPDKDMGLWGTVDVVTSGLVSLRSPMVVTHFTYTSLHTADLTIHAELHNASDAAVKALVDGTAAGAHFSEPVELALHENRTVIITPEKNPSLHLSNPKPGWPAQMGDPHLEKLTVGVSAGGAKTDEKTVDFGIRLQPNRRNLLRINYQLL